MNGRRAVARQVRCMHVGFGNGMPGYDSLNKTSWANVSNIEYEVMHTTSSKADEKLQELFGHDSIPWVHVVKDTSSHGKVDTERRTLWERALYSQTPDLRNDWMHKWKQGVPNRIGGTDVWSKFSQPDQYFLGMYPDRLAKTPGQYWKDRCGKFLYTHVIWEREKARELERYGGEFGLPTDDYQTINGVMPFLSAQAWRRYKYDMHEPVVRALNAATDGGKGDLENFIKNGAGAVNQLAIDHSVLCCFAKSIRPRGGVLREEFADVLKADAGGKAEVEKQFVSAAADQAGAGGNVWLVFDRNSKSVKVVGLPADSHPLLIQCDAIAVLPLRNELWAPDYDSAEEFAERFCRVFDWDYAFAAYCDIIDVPRPEPLVF